MENKLLETEKLSNTAQCDFVTELNDSSLVGAKSPIGAKDDEAVVVEEGAPVVGTGMKTEMGATISGGGESVFEFQDLRHEGEAKGPGMETATATETETAIIGGGESPYDLQDSGRVGDESSVAAKDDEVVVAEEETPLVGTGVETDVEAAIIEGVESLSELQVSRHNGVVSSIAAKGDVAMAVAEEDTPLVGAGMETETDASLRGGGESLSELQDAPPEGAESLIAGKDGEGMAAEEGTLLVGTGMEMEKAAAVIGGGNWVSELQDSQHDIAEPLIAPKGDDGVAAEGCNAKMEVVAETEICGGGKYVDELDDMQHVGLESSIISKDYEDNDKASVQEEIVTAESRMELEMGTEVAKGFGGGSVSQSNELQLVSAGLPIAAKEDADDELVAKEEIAMLETETEVEARAVKREGEESVPELDDSQLIAEDDQDEAVVEEDTPIADTEMETETDAAESAKNGGGKRKRGRNSRVSARAPARKTIEEDVCFICFDGGDLVLCDRR